MNCNEYQITLYNQLMELVRSNKSFFFKDHEIHESNSIVERYRIFSYRLNPQDSDWSLPGALEARGIMYKIQNVVDKDDAESLRIRLASHPMEKFFNYMENPLMKSVDLTTSYIDCIEAKADGSLISTFLTCHGSLKLKTKASLSSPQVSDAEEWLRQAEQTRFRKELQKMATMGMTVNMEWISPMNRLVVEYSKSKLVVLNIRSHTDGSYWEPWNLPEWANEITSRWIERIEFVDDSWSSFLESTRTLENVEGFVVRLKSGMRIKVKTDWYLNHNTNSSNAPRDSSSSSLSTTISSPSALFKAVLEERSDDLKSRFREDAFVCQRISKMEDLVRNAHEQLQGQIESFYQTHQEKSRKQYVKAAQEQLDKYKFELALCRYKGQHVLYTKFVQNRLKDDILQGFDAP